MLIHVSVEANELFDAYRELYFEGGLSSVYLWDLDGGFAGCFLIKKEVEGDRSVRKGVWDSIHVVEVSQESPTKATYKLTTTIMLHMEVDKDEVGDALLSGSLTRQSTLASVAVNEVKTHIANIGRMIEDMESDMRNNLGELYIKKTREVVNSIRSDPNATGAQSADHVASLTSAVSQHGRNRATDSEV